MMKWIIIVLGLVAAGFGVSHFIHMPEDSAQIPWEKMVEPGSLNKAHAFLADDCLSCHTPVKGVERDKCVACHANDTHIVTLVSICSPTQMSRLTRALPPWRFWRTY